MVVAVPWADYAPEQVETLVSAWLIRVVPGAQRVDGAGGDDGADVRAPSGDGLHIFEIKSFHRRLTRANKAQILRSLATAVKHQPTMARWTLVLPLDLTPAEIRWFEDAIVPTAPVPVTWIGRTEIEAGLSQHRDLLRSLAPGSVERRALDLVTEYHTAPVAVHPAPSLAVIEVGQGDGDVEAEFRAAYAAGGGAASMGRPVDEVVRMGPGYVQTFAGASNRSSAVVCALPDRAAVVVPMAIWRVLGKLGGGAERNGGVGAAGFPVGTAAKDGSLVIDVLAAAIDLGGGEWGPGRLVRDSGGSWSWQPIPRVNFHMSHSTRWVSRECAHLRVRAVLDLPWLTSTVQPEVTRTRRRTLQASLADSEFARVFSVLSMHRGARLPEPTWAPATGHDSYQSDRGTHLRAHVVAPDGSTALSGEVLLHVPDNAYAASVLGCVELRINFDAWRAALAAGGADLAEIPELRLSLSEVIEVLASAWGTVTNLVPLGAVDDPSRMPPAGPPFVEMHIQTTPPVTTETHRRLGLSDAVDLSALGQPTRDDGYRQETGLRAYAPLNVDRPTRRALIAKGLAQLGRSWGYIDADADDLLTSDRAQSL